MPEIHPIHAMAKETSMAHVMAYGIRGTNTLNFLDSGYPCTKIFQTKRTNTLLATYQTTRKSLSRHMETVRIYLWQHKK